MNTTGVLDWLTGAGATQATNAALDAAAARPFEVTLTIAPETRTWLTMLVMFAGAAAIVVSMKR